MCLAAIKKVLLLRGKNGTEECIGFSATRAVMLFCKDSDNALHRGQARGSAREWLGLLSPPLTPARAPPSASRLPGGAEGQKQDG